jgi:ribosomal-protein-alanine N-acetyltransferase
MEIRGRHLALRFPVAQDAEALFALAGDPRVTRWFSWGPYEDPEQSRRWIAKQQALREAGEQLDYVIHHRVHGVIGVTGLAELHRRDRRAMVGSWLGVPFWGTGANAEAKALVGHLAFEVCGLERVGAYSNPENARSSRALERLGFVREGTLRRWHRHGDTYLDVQMFGLLRDEWRAGPLAEMPATVIGAPPAAWLLGDALPA